MSAIPAIPCGRVKAPPVVLKALYTVVCAGLGLLLSSDVLIVVGISSGARADLVTG